MDAVRRLVGIVAFVLGGCVHVPPPAFQAGVPLASDVDGREMELSGAAVTLTGGPEAPALAAAWSHVRANTQDRATAIRLQLTGDSLGAMPAIWLRRRLGHERRGAVGFRIGGVGGFMDPPDSSSAFFLGPTLHAQLVAPLWPADRAIRLGLTAGGDATFPIPLGYSETPYSPGYWLTVGARVEVPVGKRIGLLAGVDGHGYAWGAPSWAQGVVALRIDTTPAR